VDRPREPLPSRVEDLPDLPSESLTALEEGLRTLGLTDLPAEAHAAIEDHLRLLLAWNEAINLTAIRDPAEAIRRHILDSLTAVSILRRQRVDAFVDIGSGGGYPGLPLALAVPARRALLVDSVDKKARFLRTAAAAVAPGGSIEAFAGRAETLAADRRHRERWPAVVARAVGSVAELAELGLPLIAPGGVLVAWKRGDLAQELAAAEHPLRVLGGGPPTVVPVDPALGLDEHVLVVVVKARPTPAGYPRDPAVRRRREIVR
jgi:16S rRNA (guanine527-N7)-methyltransferase